MIMIVYGSNDLMERKELWNGVKNLAHATVGFKWIIMGDFNKDLLSHEHLNQK